MEVMNSGSQIPALQYTASGVGGLQGAMKSSFAGKIKNEKVELNK